MYRSSYNEEAKLWSGHNLRPLYNPKMSIAQLIWRSLNAYGPKIAQISDNNGIQMSFTEICTKMVRATQNLQKRGYTTKQVFGFMACNSHHIAPIVFSSFCLGCPINTIDPSFGKIEIIAMLKITKPILMFCDVECYDVLKECLTELKNEAKIFTFGGTKDGTEPVEHLFEETHDEENFIPVEVDGENEIAIILCSSGTTGPSKGVCLSHALLLDSLGQHTFGNLSWNVMLCLSTIYWMSGLDILIKGTVGGSTRIIHKEDFSPELQLRLIEKYKVTLTVNAAHQIVLMSKCVDLTTRDLSSLIYVIAAGGRVPFEVLTRWHQYLRSGGVFVNYGLCEVGGIVTTGCPVITGKNVAGKILSGRQVKIIDEQGNRCGVNVDGEICVKTHYKFLGYYGNQHTRDDSFDKEGFMITGDIGHFDEDGHLFIVDRKKEILKYNIFPIPPLEIDTYLIESPQIESVCVVGIPKDADDLPAAVVVRAKGSNISEKDIFDLVADRFPDYYKLRGGVYFVDSLPTTPSGKVLRRKAKETAIELYNARVASP